MIKINAIGDICPIPIIKAKKAIESLDGSGLIEIMVDNDVSVENLDKFAQQKNYNIQSEKIEDNKYKVIIAVGDACSTEIYEQESEINKSKNGDNVVVISSKYMGDGKEELGQILLKGFIYSLTEMDVLPSAVIFYNSGVFITCGESQSIEDLEYLQSKGVEILSCGTCIDFYNLKDKLKVGGITNMYTITEKLLNAGNVIKI